MTTDFEAVYLHLSEQDAEFKALNQKLDRICARWGIFVASTFRETVKSLLEESFGAMVQQLWIKGKQFDIVIMHNDHILIEMTAQPKRNAQRKLERKRDLYIDHTGITPARIILAVGSINSHHAEALRQAGFEVIEPNLYEDEDE